jgi:hypothetical protein
MGRPKLVRLTDGRPTVSRHYRTTLGVQSHAEIRIETTPTVLTPRTVR